VGDDIGVMVTAVVTCCRRISEMKRFAFLSSIAALALVAHSGAVQAAKQEAAGGTMLEKMVYVTVFVKDQEKALDFYTNVLGFEKRVDSPKPDGPRALSVGLKGQDLQLVLWPGTPGQGLPFHGRSTAAFTIETKDCRKAFEVLKARGVKFDTEVLENQWGYVAVFQDPDGNRLQLKQAR
jgi:catechol 2,3-dioxygenase-like lactoylglutathione lyase family enzyme